MGRVFIIVGALLFLSTGVRANMIGSVDPRENVVWQNNPEWAHVVALGSVNERTRQFRNQCTGQFIAPDLILTNDHCVPLISPMANRFAFVTDWRGRQFRASVVAHGQDQMAQARVDFPTTRFIDDWGYDWAILRVPDSRYYAAPGQYLRVAEGAQRLHVGVVNAGFGALRVLGDRELPLIRSAFVLYLQGRMATMEDDARRRGLQRDADRLFMGNHLWSFDHFLAQHYNARNVWRLSNQRPNEGIRIPPIHDDMAQLKVDRSCRIFDGVWRTRQFGMPFDNNFIWHSCAGAGGNSGSALVDASGTVVGVFARNERRLGLESASVYTAPGLPQAMAAPTTLFYALIPSLTAGGAAPSLPSGCQASGLPRVWTDFGVTSLEIRQNICREFFEGCNVNRPRAFLHDTSAGVGWWRECFYFGPARGQYDVWAPMFMSYISIVFRWHDAGTLDVNSPNFLRNECRTACWGR